MIASPLIPYSLQMRNDIICCIHVPWIGNEIGRDVHMRLKDFVCTVILLYAAFAHIGVSEGLGQNLAILNVDTFIEGTCLANQ